MALFHRDFFCYDAAMSSVFFSPIGPVLSRIATQLGLHHKLVEHRLQTDWIHIAGSSIAAHTRPDVIRFKKLHLLVENSVWLQQLTFLKPSLLEKVQRSAGEGIIQEIVLRIGEVTTSWANEETTQECLPSLPAYPPDADAVALAASYAEVVTDPDLRARLAAVMAKALVTPPSQDRQG